MDNKAASVYSIILNSLGFGRDEFGSLFENRVLIGLYLQLRWSLQWTQSSSWSAIFP